jgi:uncharacterized Rossmann fold enzyme
MFYKDWEPIYQEIAKDFNFNFVNERDAVNLLNNLLYDKKKFQLKKIEELIKNKEVVVFGAGPSLDDSIANHKKKIENCVKISADGATSALLKNNILPDIIVTDLDGYVPDQIKANSKGSILVLHAHGDNISSLKKYFPEFNGEIIGSTQIDPLNYENVYNFGGFTDGDRAVSLSSHFKSKKIYLIGFDFNGEIGKYSKPEKKDKLLKLKKLNWCKRLIQLLNENNENIIYL